MKYDYYSLFIKSGFGEGKISSDCSLELAQLIDSHFAKYNMVSRGEKSMILKKGDLEYICTISSNTIEMHPNNPKTIEDSIDAIYIRHQVDEPSREVLLFDLELKANNGILHELITCKKTDDQELYRMAYRFYNQETLEFIASQVGTNYDVNKESVNWYSIVTNNHVMPDIHRIGYLTRSNTYFNNQPAVYLKDYNVLSSEQAQLINSFKYSDPRSTRKSLTLLANQYIDDMIRSKKEESGKKR